MHKRPAASGRRVQGSVCRWWVVYGFWPCCRGRPLPQINPQQGEALALARSAAFEARQFARARDYWQRLLVLVLVLVLALVLVLVLVLAPADSEMA